MIQRSFGLNINAVPQDTARYRNSVCTDLRERQPPANMSGLDSERNRTPQWDIDSPRETSCRFWPRRLRSHRQLGQIVSGCAMAGRTDSPGSYREWAAAQRAAEQTAKRAEQQRK